jgi:hypothetical protein
MEMQLNNNDDTRRRKKERTTKVRASRANATRVTIKKSAKATT